MVEAKTRVRKELRKLSSYERDMYKRALDVMQKLNTEDGQAIYGPSYQVCACMFLMFC